MALMNSYSSFKTLLKRPFHKEVFLDSLPQAWFRGFLLSSTMPCATPL